jgi:hypothetical protein
MTTRGLPTRLSILLVVGLLSTACAAATSSIAPDPVASGVPTVGADPTLDPLGGGSDGINGPARLDYGTDWFTGPANPMNLTVTTEGATAVTARLTTAGGTISATGPDGTTYTLEVPPDALLFDVDITLTPVATLSGWDVAPGQAVAVQLEPDGLPFTIPGRLLIRPATPIDDPLGSAFGFYAGGTDAHLLRSAQDAAEIEIAVEHFSGAGFTWNNGESFGAAWTRHRNNEAEDRLRTRLEGELGLLHERAVRGLPNDRTEVDIYREARSDYERDVTNRRLLLAGNSCKDGKQALAGYFAWNRIVETGGLPEELKLEPPPNLLDTVRYVCAEEATRSCFETGDLERLAAVLLADLHELAFQRPDMDPDTRRYLEACGRYDLVIDQHTYAFIGSAGQGWELDVDIEIRIPLRFKSGHWTGLVGDLEGEAIGQVIAGGGGNAVKCTITLRGGPGDRPYKARIPSLDFSRTVPDGETIEFEDLDLRFTEGHAMAAGPMKCPPRYPSIDLPPLDLPFVFHGDPEFSIKGWEAGSHPTIATKEFERVMTVGTVGKENLDMELIHKPGPMPARPPIIPS